MSKPTLLDLFCKAGGATKGYMDAGFLVVGVDIEPQPRYVGHAFYQADALEFVRQCGRKFDAIAASPPCQSYTPLNALSPHKTYPDLLAETREALEATGRPFVIENVMAAPLIKERSITLCGGMFGLRVYRHRRFEAGGGWSFCEAPAHPRHVVLTATKRRRERWAQGWNISVTGDVGTWCGPEAMGIDWMNGNELSEAIPPSYTRYIGEQLLRQCFPNRTLPSALLLAA